MWLNINYDSLKKWKIILITTIVFELIMQSFIYLHPENLRWIESDNFSVWNLLQFVLLDQILIETISVTIIFQLIRYFGSKMGLFEIRLGTKSLIAYELKFLPVFLLAFFVFAPFTLTARYIYHYFPYFDSVIYFDEYFYSLSLYLNYLAPVMIIGLIAVNTNLVILYNQQLSKVGFDLQKEKSARFKARLIGSNDVGESFIDVGKILWIERQDRKTIANTREGKLRLKETIGELEELFAPDRFIRINRSVLINLEYVQNYSFWEYDKYIVRIKESKKEFVMSRERLKKIKHLLVERDFSQ